MKLRSTRGYCLKLEALIDVAEGFGLWMPRSPFTAKTGFEYTVEDVYRPLFTMWQRHQVS